MAASYVCDNCGKSAASLLGWRIVSVQYLHDDGSSLTPPFSRACDRIVPDLIFDSIECATAWSEGAKIEAPPPVPPPLKVT